MSRNCGECGGATVWDEDAASSICQSCGTLTDPSQSVLSSHIDQPENTRQNHFLNPNSAATTLKSFRTRQGWDLAGQGKEARESRNTYTMHEFIRSFCAALSVPGLSPRVIILFTQAMAAGQFHWGRKAKRVAGACLAIALRETNRPDAIRDVASILEESPVILTRTFMSVLTLLNYNLSPVDPAMHVPPLELHLNSIVRNPETSNIPSTLVKKLREDSEVTTLPTGPTAAALLMLAAEAETRSSLPNIRELAQSLASTASWQASVVMSRYKLLSDLILDCVDKIPWLDKYETVKGRAKVARRIVVARSIKDMIQFYEDIWVQKREKLKNVTMDEVTPTCDFDNDVIELSSSSSICSAQDDAGKGPPRKKRRVDRSLEDAHLFILDPLAHRIPSSSSSVPVPIDENNNPRQPAPPGLTSTPPSNPSLMTYMLTVPPSTDVMRAPTRLQLLATTRGGESAVHDDELISDAEWEQMLRTDEEMTQLQAIWEQILPSDTDISEGDRIPSRSRTPDAAGLNDNEEESDSAEEGTSSYLKKAIDDSIVDAFIQEDEEVIVDEWRPLSPDTGLRAGDHYDEYND
ncbi:hypothetical protein AB1N83_000386 [Pleurotus pulmonarius]